MTPFLNKSGLSKTFCSFRTGFQRAIYHASNLVVAYFFWSIWYDSQFKTVIGVTLKVSRWFWTFIWIIMLIPYNFCITFGFTKVMSTTRTIPFRTIIFIFSMKQGLYISSFPSYYNSKTTVSEFVKFLQKMPWFNSLSSQ